MQDTNKLIQLLEAEQLHLEEARPQESYQERIERICHNNLEGYIEKTNENANKIVNSTKLYLKDYPFIFTSTIRTALVEINRKVGRDKITGFELSAAHGGKEILIHHAQIGNSLEYFSTPVYDRYGEFIPNLSFLEDQDLGYVLLSRVLREILEKKGSRFPCKIELKNNPLSSSKYISFDNKGEFFRQSTLAREFVIYKDSYSRMLRELEKEMNKWITGNDFGIKLDDILFKKVEKAKDGKKK